MQAKHKQGSCVVEECCTAMVLYTKYMDLLLCVLQVAERMTERFGERVSKSGWLYATDQQRLDVWPAHSICDVPISC
jgi:NAD-dependent oxidoreductase involved in siderophore biosynthesis